MTDNQESLQSEPEVPKEPNDGRPWMQIFLQADGSIKVTGWVQDKLLAYGLLGSAKDAIQEVQAKEVKIHRVNNSGGLLNMIRSVKR